MEHALARFRLAVNESMTVIIIRSLIIARGVPTAKTGRIGTFTATRCSLF